ncbi:MAG TPA: hypothetical protein VF469_14365 [Kofleriaceae bacterium]
MILIHAFTIYSLGTEIMEHGDRDGLSFLISLITIKVIGLVLVMMRRKAGWHMYLLAAVVLLGFDVLVAYAAFGALLEVIKSIILDLLLGIGLGVGVLWLVISPRWESFK